MCFTRRSMPHSQGVGNMWTIITFWLRISLGGAKQNHPQSNLLFMDRDCGSFRTNPPPHPWGLDAPRGRDFRVQYKSHSEEKKGES